MDTKITKEDLKNSKHLQKFNQGVQGITGLIEFNNNKYVYKVSQFMDYLAIHEYNILKGLNELQDYCPHFVKVVDLIQSPINKNSRNIDQNPFEYNDNDSPIELEVLLLEYLPNTMTLYDLIVKKEAPIHQVISCLKQVLVSISMAQELKRFTHYDLHTINILVNSCKYNDVNVYILDDNNAVCVPTFGKHSTIIDFGFSSSIDLNGHPMCLSLCQTHVGYMCPAYDPIADFKILLLATADDFNCRPDDEGGQKLKTITRNLFKCLSIDLKTGWDNLVESSITKDLFKYIENIEEKSKLFANYDQYCMDILHGLIELPLGKVTQGSLHNLKKAYRALVHEFKKLEDLLPNSFYALYLLRQLVAKTRDLYTLYINDSNSAITEFKNYSLQVIRSIVPLKNTELNTSIFERLLCSMYMFRNNLDYILYNHLKKSMKRKHDEYMKLEVPNIESIYAVLDMNFDTPYKFSERSVINIYDKPNKSTSIITLNDEDIKYLNSHNHITWGSYLAQIYHDLDLDSSDPQDETSMAQSSD